MAASPHAIVLDVNGEEHAFSVPVHRTLLDALRNDLGLTGSKRGCNVGTCGACSVLVDGVAVRSCLSLAVNTTGCAIITVEGLGPDRPSPMQQAFLDAGAIQCGFCMTGMVIAATALLAENPRPTRAEIRAGLAGNLCRCSGYVKIIEAVELAAANLAKTNPVAEAAAS